MNKNGKHRAGHALPTPSEVTDACHLYLQLLQRKEAGLYTLTQACIFTKGKTTYIYTDSQYASGVAHDFGMLWQQHPMGLRLKTVPTSKIYWVPYFCRQLWL